MVTLFRSGQWLMSLPPVKPAIGAAVWIHLAFNRFNERKSKPPLSLAGMPANRTFQAAPNSGFISILRYLFDHL